jgi:large exoprotein involved in heme utilization and adhesion
VTIDVVENITLDGGGIGNQVYSDEVSSFVGLGNSGNITINTGSLELINGGEVDASTFGQGNAGAVNVTAIGDITAMGNITISGESSTFPSNITSLVNDGAEGSSGGVTISTSNLNLTKGGRVGANTFGQGNAGERIPEGRINCGQV